MKLNLLVGCLISLLVACGGENQNLEQIDSLLESDPGRALMMIERINPETLNTKDKAYFGLLRAHAQYKNFLDIQQDTLFRIAYKKFSSSPSSEKFIRIHFLKAISAYEAKQYANAMWDVLPAFEAARKIDDYFWMAKTSELIADIYYDVYNYRHSEIFVKKAIKFYGKANRITNQQYCLTDLAAIYLNENKNLEALKLLDSLKNVVTKEIPIDSSLLQCIEANLFSTHLALEDAEPDKKIYIANQNIGAALEYSEFLRQHNELEESKTPLAEVEENINSDVDSVRLLYAKYCLYMAEENFNKAAYVADSVISFQSNIAGRILEESVLSKYSEYYITQTEFEKHKTHLYRTALGVAIPVLLIIIVLITLLARMRLRIRLADLEATMASFASYREKSEQNRLQVADQNEIIEELFKEQWTTINMLCNEYFERANSELTRRTIVNNIEIELSKLCSKDNLEKIEVAVNRYMGGISAMLRKECPWLKEDDIQFITLIFAGLSTRAVCMFTGIKYKYYYLKKSRLSKRISDSDAPHRDLFLSKF